LLSGNLAVSDAALPVAGVIGVGKAGQLVGKELLSNTGGKTVRPHVDTKEQPSSSNTGNGNHGNSSGSSQPSGQGSATTGTATGLSPTTDISQPQSIRVSTERPQLTNTDEMRLGFDSARGTVVQHEALAAREIEISMSGQLERVKSVVDSSGRTLPGPDFKFVDGPYAGKTIDFMYTDGRVNPATGNTWISDSYRPTASFKQLQDHLNKPSVDYIVLDFRNLNDATRAQLYTRMQNELSPDQLNRIIIMHNTSPK
jgi:hypothetical protein